MVLATVVGTTGSTYSKVGEHMLFAGDGTFSGMLSGGCLEGDLAERAARVLHDDVAQIAHYDLHEGDAVWGLGVGCEGTMQVFLQALKAEQNYEPYATIVEVLQGRETVTVQISAEQSIVVAPPPALLILGAGADSEPVVNIAAELGWHCTVADHRPAYLDSRDFGDLADTICTEGGQLSVNVDLSRFDMALVMSHHLPSDAAYLTQLADTTIGYVGLLGPPSRRDRLMQGIGDAAERLAGRLSAPAGLQLGGRGAGSIAVEIIAEMQQFIEDRKLSKQNIS